MPSESSLESVKLLFDDSNAIGSRWLNRRLSHVVLNVVRFKERERFANEELQEFANELLRSKKVAVVPGTAFGNSGEGFIRISYAYSLDDLKLALGRVEEFITELREKKAGNGGA